MTRLKIAAWACKTLAIFVSVVVPALILHPRWGLNRVADVQLVGLGVLSLIPNRWLVFSRVSFVTFLLLTLFPFQIYLHPAAYENVDWALAAATGWIVGALVFGPLPASLVLSRVRLNRGERFIFA